MRTVVCHTLKNLWGLAAWVGALGVLSGCGEASDGGEKAFVAYCSACHGADGRGVDRAGPPFVGSSWVDGSESRLVRIVLHGVRGTIEVGGKTYSLEMPSFGVALDDVQISRVLTYVRRRFGSTSKPVTPEDVARIRAETRNREKYWTAEELLELR